MSPEAPLRVLVGMPFAAALGGGERFLRTFALQAGDHGLDLRIAFFDEGPLERELAARGVPTAVVPLGRFRHVRRGASAVQALRGLVDSWGPQLLLGWLPRAHVYLAQAGALSRPRPRVAWWQRHLPPGDVLDRVATLIPADGIVCSSRAAATAQLALRPRRRCVVCHPGIEPPAAAPRDRIAELRARLEIPPERPVVGLPGRLVRWKGQDRFVRALALLRDRGRDVHGLIVGGTAHGIEPEYGAEVEGLVDELGLRERCTLTGHVDDPMPYVQLMDVLVNASEGEPFGRTLLEAMALAVPVIAVDRAGPREIVRHGESGWLVPDGRPETLADAIDELVASEALRARLAAGGRARWKGEFTADAMAGRAAHALRELAA